MWDKQPKLRFTQSELKILHNIIYFLPFCLMKDYNTLITSLRLALPTVRRAKPPLGTVRVLIINLPRKGLTPRACMGDIGSGSWAPELTTFMLHVISASPFWTIFIATFSIVVYNIVIPVINSITSINLKKAGMASRNIVLKEHCLHVVISFAVVFGLLGFLFLILILAD